LVGIEPSSLVSFPWFDLQANQIGCKRGFPEWAEAIFPRQERKDFATFLQNLSFTAGGYW